MGVGGTGRGWRNIRVACRSVCFAASWDRLTSGISGPSTREIAGAPDDRAAVLTPRVIRMNSTRAVLQRVLCRERRRRWRPGARRHLSEPRLRGQFSQEPASALQPCWNGTPVNRRSGWGPRGDRALPWPGQARLGCSPRPRPRGNLLERIRATRLRCSRPEAEVNRTQLGCSPRPRPRGNPAARPKGSPWGRGGHGVDAALGQGRGETRWGAAGTVGRRALLWPAAALLAARGARCPVRAAAARRGPGGGITRGGRARGRAEGRRSR